MVVTRDLLLAWKMLGDTGMPCVQAPLTTVTIPGNAPPVSFAELLWRQGWSDGSQLRALVEAWVQLIRLFSPDVIVLDHSPTAALAAWATGLPRALIGTGFEIPPRQTPWPPFPLLEGVTPEQIRQVEHRLLSNANAVLTQMRAPPLRSPGSLYETDARYLTTVAELDHYGARENERYVGPIGRIEAGKPLRGPEKPPRACLPT